MFGFILKSQVSSLRVGFYDYKVLANPLTWILLVTLIVSVVTQVSYSLYSLCCFSSVKP